MQPSLMKELTGGQQLLQSRGVKTARLECELLLTQILGVQRHWLYLNGEEPLTMQQCKAFHSMLERRLNGEPLQYILESCEFMALPFQVDRRVLIPRWETELLVETVQKAANSRRGSPHILDLGTGSGAIAISLAYYLPQAKITAVDIKEEALQVARENAHINGVSHRIIFLQGDLFSPLEFCDGQFEFDFIVSNPPYIPTEQIPQLMEEVRDHEPVTALDGGVDGLVYYRRIAEEAWRFLKKDGLIAIEIGYGQSHAVRNIFLETSTCWEMLEIIKDLAGIERIMVFQKIRGV